MKSIRSISATVLTFTAKRAAASKSKDGHPVFRNCKWNDDPGLEIPSHVLEEHKEYLVVMSDYGMRLEEEEINDTDTNMIYDELLRAVNKAELILELSEQQRQ